GYRWIGPVLVATSQPAGDNEANIAPEILPKTSVAGGAPKRIAPIEPPQSVAPAFSLFAPAPPPVPLPRLFLWRHYRHRDPISSIAILPFDNLSAPAFDDAFSDGLTDEVASSISQLPGVRVIGRRSAYFFKGKHDDLRSIGSRLNVEAVVEG